MRKYRTYFIAIVVLIVADIVFSFVKQSFSGNLRHIQDIPKIIRNIQSSEAPSILLLGNSLTNNGFLKNIFENQLGPNIKAYNVEKITPDGTDLWDWHFIVQNQILDKNIKPKVIITGFAWDILADLRPPNPTRLGGYFCDIEDLWFLNNNYSFTISQNSEFLLSKASSIYANRDAISKRLLYEIIPAFKDTTRLINDFFTDASQTATNKNAYTYNRLKLFINNLQQNKIEVVFVAMPVTRRYTIDSALIAAIESSQGYFYDARTLSGIQAVSFKDPIHLNNQGSKVMSVHVIQYLTAHNLI